MEIGWGEILGTVSAMFAAWLAYNQERHNKMTDLKIEQYKKEEERRSFRRNENTAKVYGILWKVLYALKADRVYIIQPHPLGKAAYLSIQFEVVGKGIDGIKEQVQNLPMSEIPKFSNDLAENLFMYIKDVDTGVPDNIVKSLMAVNGCSSVIIKRLNNSTDWVGSIVAEYMEDMAITEDESHKIMHEAAVAIQYILPDIREIKI